MIIYFEGLSCSGKTSLINYLTKEFNNCISVPELPQDYYGQKKISTDFCRDNDQRKCVDALEADNEERLVLVDRSYVSTIVYEFIQFGSDCKNQYKDTLRWYFKNILNKKLIKPHVYVYLSIDKETALERSKALNRFTTKFAWYINPQLGIDFYRAFFNFFEPEIPVIVIDGFQDERAQMKVFWEEIKKIKYDE